MFHRVSRVLGPFIIAGALVAVGLTAWAASPAGPFTHSAGAPTPKPTPPAGPATAADFDALVASSRSRQDQFVRDFMASRQDPRTLQRVVISATAPLIPNLGAAVAAADTIVRGRVESTSFAPSDSGTPVATSTIRITQIVKAGRLTPGQQQLSLRQIGGPVPQANGGVLAQLETDELVLPGDDVVLLLSGRSELGADLQALPVAGIYFVTKTGILAEHSNVFGNAVNGQVPELFTARIQALVR